MLQHFDLDSVCICLPLQDDTCGLVTTYYAAQFDWLRATRVWATNDTGPSTDRTLGTSQGHWMLMRTANAPGSSSLKVPLVMYLQWDNQLFLDRRMVAVLYPYFTGIG